MAQHSNAYSEVIADLKRRRAEIDRMIAGLEALAAGGSVPAGGDASPPDLNKPVAEEPVQPDENNPYLGMNIFDAAKIVLSKKRRAMAPAEIHRELENGGLVISNPNTVASVLHRRSRNVGDVVSPKRGKWGLKEWYPNKSFGKKGPGESGEKDTTDGVSDQPDVTEEPEMRSEPASVLPLRSNG